MTIRFDEFELSPDAYELRASGQPVAIEPQVLDVLCYLVEHRDRVVTKEELLDNVWGDRFVSESALTSRIKTARQVLGDDGRTQRYIKTVHGRGYRFQLDDGADVIVTTETAHRHNLPAERTPLLGRDEAIDHVVGLLANNRLVTLVGIGGTGKTRVAVAAARRLLDRFPDGVWFVDLVPIARADELDRALARAAGLAATDRRDVVELLRERRALFVLDNCEHVIGDVVTAVDALLDGTDELRVLATSREPTALPDEHRLLVEPLAVDDHGPAVELLRATAARFGTDLEAEDEQLADICRRLDGLPLAIELAAAQLRHLGPGELEERLDRRFELLVDPAQRRPDRQSSLAVVLEDTWSLIDPPAQSLLAGLAAFPGPFRRADVEEWSPADIGDTAAGLASLLDHNLVVREPGAVPAFRLLETVRLFVDERSDDTERRERRDRHADWCVRRIDAADTEYYQDIALADWCADHGDDLRVAVLHLLDTGREAEAAQLDAAAANTAQRDEGPRASEVLARLDQHLAHQHDDRLLARLHLGAVLCGMATRAPQVMAAHGPAAIEAARRAGDPVLLSQSLVLGSWMEVFADPDGALAMIDEARAVARAADAQGCIDLADGYGAFYLAVQDRFDEAIALVEPAVQRRGASAASDISSMSCLVALASLVALDEPDRAVRWIEDLLGRSPSLQMWGSGVLVASIQAADGDAAGCRARLVAVRDRLDQAGRDGLPDLLVPVAAMAWQRGDLDRAGRLLSMVRAAGHPTQSFQVTTVYRRLRERVPVVEHGPDDSAAEAFDWLDHMAEEATP